MQKTSSYQRDRTSKGIAIQRSSSVSEESRASYVNPGFVASVSDPLSDRYFYQNGKKCPSGATRIPIGRTGAPLRHRSAAGRELRAGAGPAPGAVH